MRGGWDNRYDEEWEDAQDPARDGIRGAVHQPLEIRKRPALVIFQEYGNVVVAGITSNTEMRGIPLSREEGASESHRH